MQDQLGFLCLGQPADAVCCEVPSLHSDVSNGSQGTITQASIHLSPESYAAVAFSNCTALLETPVDSLPHK
jgi:hypothetical protein